MQDFLAMVPNTLDGAIVPVATALAAVLVFLVKGLFSLARRFAKKTPVSLDDKLIDATEEQLKAKAREL
jgi:hypothetical protein